jgi:aminoglycoside phosphotransferase (APT) family kinase protein
LHRTRNGTTGGDAAERAGETLRLLHTIPVSGVGQLDIHGTGHHTSIGSWLRAAAKPRIPTTVPDHVHALLERGHRTLHQSASSLPPRIQPKLLHGDWTARHVLTDGQDITGILDLESVRGGDPLTDLAGFSLQECAELTRALFTGYFPGGPPAKALLPLTLYRLRIAISLLQYHARCGDTALLDLRAAQIKSELDDLASGVLSPTPRITQGHPTTTGDSHHDRVPHR